VKMRIDLEWVIGISDNSQRGVGKSLMTSVPPPRGSLFRSAKSTKKGTRLLILKVEPVVG